MSKLSTLTNLDSLASDDLLEVVDVSDTTTMTGGGGTNKKITAATLANQLSTIGNYAAASHTHSAATNLANGFMSSTDKAKLDGIASGAEVNVQADWTATTGDAFIQNKPGLATTSLSGFMSSTDKTKLDGLSNYTHPTGDGNLHVPATGTNNSGKVLTAGATAGSLSWTTPTASVSLDSPAFTGTPTAPTAQTGTNTTQIATTAFVKTAVDSASFGSGSNPTYIITSNVPTVAEGTAVTFTVTTTDSTVTQLYWTTASTDVTPVNGTITLNGNSGTFITTAIADSTSEGIDTFTIQIRTDSITGTIVGTCSVNISDNPVVYTLTPNKNTVVEGQSVTFNVSATNTPGTLLYWIATDGADQLITTQGVVPITSNVGSFSVTVKNDSIVETGSYFIVKLRLNNVNGTDIGSATINISDISASNTVWIADTPNTSDFYTSFHQNCFDVNANGNLLAVIDDNADKVTIYELTNVNSWNKVSEFNTFTVTANSAEFARISMNAAGNRVVIGSPSGVVAVCEYNGSSWNRVGGVITNPSNGFGSAVSINDVGDRIIIGGNGDFGAGGTWLYIWNGLSWSRPTALAGSSVAWPFVDINAAGDIIVVANIAGDGYIYTQDSGWNYTSTPSEQNDRISSQSRSVSINAAGNIVAIGHSFADSNGINNRGKVTIYHKMTPTSPWVKMGQDIFGEAENDFSGFSVSLNAAGDRVAIGATNSDDFGTDHGHVRVYAYDGVNWNQVGADIGNTNYSSIGRAVRLNSTGNRVYTLGLNEIISKLNIFSYTQQ